MTDERLLVNNKHFTIIRSTGVVRLMIETTCFSWKFNVQLFLFNRLLRSTSHIILDEIHERDLLSDFLIIIVRDLLPLRYVVIEYLLANRLLSSVIKITMFRF